MTVSPQVPRPQAPRSHPARRWRQINRADVVAALLVLNLIGLIGLAARVYRGDKPIVVTVGITQMSRAYMAKLATTNITPQEARIRTELFLAVAQDAVKQAASRKGIIVVPRECVLAGEFSDMTAEVERAVTETLDRKTASAPGLGLGSGDVRP